MATQRFKRGRDEPILLKLEGFAILGKETFVGALTAKTTKQAELFLTPNRVVCTKQRRYMPWGLAVWIYFAFNKRVIIWEAPTDTLTACTFYKDSNAYIFKFSDGTERKFRSGAMFGTKQSAEWFEALRSAAPRAQASTQEVEPR